MHTVHEGEVCPVNAQFGIVNMPGVGMSSVGVYAAKQTEILLGDEFDECNAGLRFGTQYDRRQNVELLHDFVEANRFDTAVLFLHSFGAIAGIDSIVDYQRLYPDAGTKFAVIFFSSPGDIDDLQPFNWAAAQTLARISLDKGAIEAMTYFSTLSQGDKSPFDPKVLEDVEKNSNDTPPTLVRDETKRLISGIERLPEGLDVPLYYIGDQRDEVVKVEQAIATIKRLTGREITAIKRLQLPSGRMSFHADLWWPENHEAYKPTVKEYLYDALGRLGTPAKAPSFKVACTMGRISCR
jgi:pimeloyl-ACP methyl ester carboxylesterase